MKLGFFGLVLAVSAGMASAQADVKPVKLMTVMMEPPRSERTFYGHVTARKSVDLAFQVPGQVIEFPVIEGLEVPKGALIAKLDLEPFELRHQQAVLQKEQADRNVVRLKRLQGTVSQVQIDDAETQAGLSKIALRTAEYELDHATLEAPFDALVSSRNVELFTTVNAGSPVVRLHDMSEVHIEIDVPEVLFQRSERDPSVEIFAEFAGHEGKFPLNVLEFAAEASTVGQTFQVTMGMTPPEGMVILPGSSVTVSVTAELGNGGIQIPATAVVTDPSGKTGVMVYEPAGSDEGTVSWVEVKLEPKRTGFLVTSGLKDKQEVVVTGGSGLASGDAVRRFTGFAN
jgi:RND family efflux transporter MFP subunit